MEEDILDDIDILEDPLNIQPKEKDLQLDSLLKHQMNQQLQSIIKKALSLSDYLHKEAQTLVTMLKGSDMNSFLEVNLTCQIKNATPSPICSATVGYSNNKNTIFKCFDCMEANNAIQCIDCFSKADHKGHHYIEAFSGQGCCDCGNEEMFNPKGFCPNHSKKIDKIEIDEDVRRKFLKEGSFYLYLSFWLLERAELFLLQDSLIKKVVEAVMNGIYECSCKDYDQKLLVYQLFKLKLNEVYPDLPKIPYTELTIIELLFKWEKRFSAMETFCRIAFEIFPVQESRVDIIKCFFEKTRNDPTFDFHHPLRYINFQFMTCIKTINHLIKKGQLKPLQLPSLQRIKQERAGDHLFVKFIDDMQYPSDMKGQVQYHSYLVEMCNIATILSLYRELPDDKVHKKILDNYYIKTFRHLLRNIRNEPKLLTKIIKELWEYIKKVQQPNISLIHERMFAFAMSTYLQGQISKLNDPSCLNQILVLLDLGQNQVNIISGRVEYHLSNYVQCLCAPALSIPDDYVKDYFIAHNPQFALGLKLDHIYQKILILLSRKRVDYAPIIRQLCTKLDSYKSFLLFSFLHGITTIEADQIQIETQIELVNKQRLQLFYSKYMNSFKELNAIELKKKGSLIIQNPEPFQSFVSNNCRTEKGRLVTELPCQPLELLGYHPFLEFLHLDLFHQPNKNYQMTQLPYLKGVNFWNNQSAQTLISVCRETFDKKKGEKANYNQSSFLPSKLGLQVVKAYLSSKNEILKHFLEKELIELSQGAGCQTLSTAIINVLSLQSKSPNSKKEESTRNRSLLLEKKREKQAKLKQDREAILSKHKLEEKQVEGDLCIFCREDTQEQLCLLSWVGLDNLVTKSILKTDSFRLCFRTCSHKIHRKCFYQDQDLIEKQCYLCRRPTNLLLPQFSNNQKPGESGTSFFDVLFMTLLECITNEEHQKLIYQFNERYCENNMARAMVNSIICQVLLFEDHQDGHTKRYVVPIIKELIHFLKNLPKDLLENAFAVDKKVMIISGTNAQNYFRTRQILEKYLMNQKKEESSLFDKQICQILSFFDGTQTNVSSLKEIYSIKARQYLLDLPVNLSKLQHFMGECPSCHKVTESLCMCLVCSYRVCTGEKQKLKEHFNSHLGGCIFIKCDNGKPLYFLQGQHLFLRKSIYLNYLGESFQNHTMVKQNSSNFNLDRQKYELMVQKIVRGEVKSLVMQQLT